MNAWRGIVLDNNSGMATLSGDAWGNANGCVPAQMLPHGTKIQNVGLTHSTVIADLDFETYSEAGYYFDPTAKEGLGQWRIVPGAPASCKSGLAAVGGVNYAAHPTTEVLMMAYDLKDGGGSRLWLPWMPLPLDLFAYIEAGGLVAAWNAAFEYWVWKSVCEERMGWPPLRFWQLRDDMAKAQAFGLPGMLKNAGIAIKSDEQKQDDGLKLINKFSKPQNPLKSKPNRMRTFVADEPVDGPKFCGYNVQDIVSEASIAALCPDLSAHEEQVWLCDQAINVRGIQIDLDAVDAFIELVYQAQDKYRTELQQITYSAPLGKAEVLTESKAKDMRIWCNDRGATLSCLDEDAVDAELERTDLAPNVRRVLEIRQLLSSAAVKKLFTMKLKTGPDGRMHNVFTYCGAQKTSRWAGRDIQPQNLPAKSLKVAKCRACGHIKLSKADLCLRCGDMVPGQDPHPWDDEAVNEVIRIANQGDLETFQEYWGDPLTAISACIRGLLTCAPGNDLICSDFSAIEAVVLAFMSGCQWRMDVFNTHGRIYEMSAANISGVPFEEIMASAGFTDTTSPNWWEAIVEGTDHVLRKTIGKVAELACFGADTKVLTDSGWKRIVDVTTADKLHDGVEFVSHDGVVPRGSRLTTTLDGVIVTPDHKFYTGRNQWKTTDDLKANSQDLKRARNTARSLLSRYEQSQLRGVSWLSSVLASVGMSESSTSQTYEVASPPGATLAPSAKAVKRQLSMMRDARTRQKDVGSLIESLPQSVDALIGTIDSSPHMVAEASEYIRRGLKTKTFGSRTYVHLNRATTPAQLSTDATMIEGMSPETCALLRTANNKTISDRPFGSSLLASKCPQLNSTDGTPQTLRTHTPSLESCKREKAPTVSSSSRTQEVFDVINCGPRSRFVVLTERGPLIAHNSGYQGWIGAWCNFGADKFMSNDEMKKAILKWRADSPEIVEFWGGQYRRTGYRQTKPELYGVEGCAIAAVLNPGTVYQFRELQFGVKDNILYVRLPSGRSMTYHEPELYDTTDPLGIAIKQLTFMGVCPKSKKWVRRDTYGGRMTENIIQAVARDIQANSIVQLEKAGYSVVIHVHDEIISEVKQGTGSIEHFESIMSTMPDWCAHWPVKAKGGWRGTRYKKD